MAATIRILPTPERMRHAVIDAIDVMAEDDSGHLQTKSIAFRVRNQRRIDDYLRLGDISEEQHAACMRLIATYTRAGLECRPASLDLMRSGGGVSTCGMAASEIQAAARIVFRKALEYLGDYRQTVIRVVCEDMPVIPVQVKRGAAYQAARAYAVRDLCAALDKLVKFWGM